MQHELIDKIDSHLLFWVAYSIYTRNLLRQRVTMQLRSESNVISLYLDMLSFTFKGEIQIVCACKHENEQQSNI